MGIINETEPEGNISQSNDIKKKKYKDYEHERYIADKAADKGCNNFLCSEDTETAKLFSKLSCLLVPIVEKCFGESPKKMKVVDIYIKIVYALCRILCV